jgi:titin
VSRIGHDENAHRRSDTAFEIERSTDGARFTPIATTGADVTTYVDGGLPRRVMHYYRVRAVAGQLASPYSNVAKAKPR